MYLPRGEIKSGPGVPEVARENVFESTKGITPRINRGRVLRAAIKFIDFKTIDYRLVRKRSLLITRYFRFSIGFSVSFVR